MDQEKAHKKCLISVGSIFLLGIEHDAGSTSPCGDWGTNLIHPFTIRNSDPTLLLLLFQIIKNSGSKELQLKNWSKVFVAFLLAHLFPSIFQLVCDIRKDQGSQKRNDEVISPLILKEPSKPTKPYISDWRGFPLSTM